MTTFYLLPPRPTVADRLAATAAGCFPGLAWPLSGAAELLGVVEQAAEAAGACVVFRDDLPDGEPAETALLHGFGAAPGDRVVEVRFCGPGPAAAVQTAAWVISAGGAAA
jgi:hypothetical protein